MPTKNAGRDYNELLPRKPRPRETCSKGGGAMAALF